MLRLLTHLRFYWIEVVGRGIGGVGEKLDMLVSFYYLIWLSKYFPEKEASISVWGLKITADRPKTLQQSLLEIFVHEVYRFDSRREAPVILDAGANIGVSVLYFSQKYPEAQIIAVEPNPKALAYLRKNVAANKLRNVIIYPAALGKQEGKGVLVEYQESLLNATVQEAGSAESIDILTLSSLMEKHRIDLIKLDIEGAELDLLAHWEQKKPLPQEIIVEIHPNAYPNLPVETVEKLLYAYHIERIDTPFGTIVRAQQID